MGRKRTGRLVERRSGWRAHVTLTIDGVAVRKMVDLGTTDRAVAKRKLRALLRNDQHESAEAAVAAAETPLSVAEAVEQAHARWQGEDLGDAATRLGRLRDYVLPHIGDMAARSVQGSDVSDVLLAAKAAGLSKQSVLHVRNAMNAVFKDLWLDQVIDENPVSRSRMP
ncbi:MAG: hypothetical protein KC731_24455, partial [Myxococcales bacterium]|nr:hypothetical protein [Myxococcales bacterium]